MVAVARRVLIVEDESIVQLHLRMVMEELGYAVSGVASTGNEAISSAASSQPDLALIDVRLPGGRDGIETARELRRHHDLAIVFLTACGDDETVARAMQIGANGYVVKPFSKPQLRATVTTALNEHARAQSARRAHPALRSTSTGADRPFGAGTRMAMFSHDTLGLGHLQRSMNLSRTLTALHPGLSILLLTGSPAVHRYALPKGVDYIKLPAVRKVAPEAYEARTLGVDAEGVLRLRTNLALRSLQDYDPDFLLVDHAPTGMKGELLPALEWLTEHRPNCKKLLGLRDIIDSPAYVAQTWREQGTYDVLRQHYDGLVVYGCREIYDPTVEYGFDADLRAKTTFCHYVSETAEPGAAAVPAEPGTRPLVVVTIGGGDGGGEAVIGTTLQMLRKYEREVDFDTLVFTGPFLDSALAREFAAQAAGLPVRLCDFVTSTAAEIARAELVISTCGYNTMTQNLAHARRALIIPRVMHRQEQLIRAERFAALGLVECLHPERVTVDSLWQQVRAQLRNPRQPLAEARANHRVALDGAERLAHECARLAAR